ncbi:MAG: hypothetical protein JXR76_28980 [Deltaproteobacteria bacterium]|nr:hypothetical protein [Deltaproteobacteria bacterium]
MVQRKSDKDAHDQGFLESEKPESEKTTVPEIPVHKLLEHFEREAARRTSSDATKTPASREK